MDVVKGQMPVGVRAARAQLADRSVAKSGRHAGVYTLPFFLARLLTEGNFLVKLVGMNICQEFLQRRIVSSDDQCIIVGIHIHDHPVGKAQLLCQDPRDSYAETVPPALHMRLHTKSPISQFVYT